MNLWGSSSFSRLVMQSLGGMQKNCVYLCTSAADWRWSLVCFHNHCLFYVSVGDLTELIHYTVSLHMVVCTSSAIFRNTLSLLYVFN